MLLGELAGQLRVEPGQAHQAHRLRQGLFPLMAYNQQEGGRCRISNVVRRLAVVNVSVNNLPAISI